MGRQVFWFQFAVAVSVTALMLPFGVQQRHHDACATAFPRGEARIDCILEMQYPNHDN